VAFSVALVTALLLPSAVAVATPLADRGPLTFGSYSGIESCDSGGQPGAGRCYGDLVLDGRFSLGGGSIKATARFEYDGPDDASTYEGSIASERFQGPCTVHETSERDLVDCDLVIDGGASTEHLVFAYQWTDALDDQAYDTGVFAGI
jgi:hypothetical protein